MKKSISILGSTGSVGLTTLGIIDKYKSLFSINLLSANKNFNLICRQIKKYKPLMFIVTNKKIFQKVRDKFKNKQILIFNNFKFKKLKKSDVTISAIPGISGLQPTITLIKLSKKILLANKESIICGWDFIKKAGIKNNTKIVPVDSEHYSILKLLENKKISDVKKIFITASGGPFLNYKENQFKTITPKDALKHPKWKMGKKITIDSSTLMNKILELIEAQKLFNIPNNKIDILIHPNSLVHAIVQYKNGLTKFIYHETSMIIPLANALFDGHLNIDKLYKNNKIKFKKNLENLTFSSVNNKTFPLVKLKDRIDEYVSTPIVINASNEILVDHFLQKKIPFLAINKIIMGILRDRNYKKYAIRKPKNINQIYEIDLWARKQTVKYIKRYFN